MSAFSAEWDDRDFMKALGYYCDLKKSVDKKKELRRRAKNVGLRLVRIYKQKGVNLSDITTKVKSLGKRVKVRPKIRAKKGTFKKMIAMELRARKSAKGFTATGWFPSVEKLGGTPRDTVRRTGPRRGKLIEKLGLGEMSETLVNEQPGAAHLQEKASSDMQAALDAETDDMCKYIIKKLDETKRKAGL